MLNLNITNISDEDITLAVGSKQVRVPAHRVHAVLYDGDTIPTELLDAEKAGKISYKSHVLDDQLNPVVDKKAE